MSSRVALVTGGAQGIGRGIATTLGVRGYAVAVADLKLETARETAESINASGGKAVAVQADVTDTASVQAAVKTVTAELGPVEVAVNNAGWDDFMPFLDTTEEFWDRILDINFKGALRVVQAVVPGMIERGWGRVVNIGSDAGRVGSSMEAVYSGAKGGIIAFTKKLSQELGPFGITVNAIAPSMTLTERIRPRWEQRSADEQAQEVARTPLRRMAEARDQARVICFLASADADFVTGVTIDVTGGL